jgi:fatty-acyl-CoA synthase
LTTLVGEMGAAAARGQQLVFVHDDDRHESIAWTDLDDGARRVAAGLIAKGVLPGARVPIVLPTSPGFVTAFFGTMLAGAIPCPMALPMGFAQIEIYAQRFAATLRYLGATHAVIDELLAPIAMMYPEVTFLGGKSLGGTARVEGDPTLPDDLAFLQCTSGSTGTPKGVMLSHRNLVANIDQSDRALDAAPGRDTLVSWLPLYHDMGLIGTLLFPMVKGLGSVLMSPLKFQKRPASWLAAMSRYRATITTAPNFAYAYVTARVKDAELAGLDLSALRHACCGAEPIDRRTLEAFVARFQAIGVRASVPRPCYGLAEASLAVTFRPADAPLVYDRLDTAALAAGEVRPGGERATEAVRCGRPVLGTEVAIVDDDRSPLPERRVGRILVRGPSVTRGYYQLPEETAAVLRDGWLDTGDLGYLIDGELVVTGRAKDLVIVRGQKFAPNDFEWAAEQTPGVRRGTAVAFNGKDGELVVACEIDTEVEGLRADLAARVAAQTGLKPDVVALSTERHATPKTSSGKLQRQRTRELVLGGRSPWRIA